MSIAAAKPDADHVGGRNRSESGTGSYDQGPRRRKQVCLKPASYRSLLYLLLNLEIVLLCNRNRR